MLEWLRARRYRAHMAAEIEHYSKVYSGPESRARLIEPVPASWAEIQRLAAEKIQAETGADITGHVLARLRARERPRLLSLGSGPGGVEMVFARECPEADYVCMDVNAELLALGRARAAEEGLPVIFEQADLNAVTLPRGAFDLVFCHAVLHHVVELERLAAQIAAALRPAGELIVVDVITRRGQRMWPETRRTARAIFRTLPERYRVNHTAYSEKRTDRDLWEGDTSRAGMECVRSEDILPVLRARFRERLFVPYLAFSRRFFDTMYGPNYDLTRPLDSALLRWIWELDCDSLARGALRPESFFGVYAAS
ncbi:MAG: class I SAM-dependent methyltransferase [Bryobacteraceae bacterium]